MQFAERLAAVQATIATACDRAGRDPASVVLMAVTKGQTPSVVEEAFQAGLTLFGENKVQEAKSKIPLCPSRITWHMIGHLQTNKVRDALACFSLVQSVDSLRLAAEIDRLADKMSKTIRIFLEVNVAGESSKFGYHPSRLLEDLPALAALRRIEIHGLMTIAPWSADPERARPFFKELRELRRRCEEQLGAPLEHLSMGMSGDFATAIEEGSTLIRVGTLLFGPRARRAEPVAEE